MSTKSTIAHGQNFHFYREIFDEEHVWLTLEGTEFRAGPGHVTLAIPAAIWEVIRRRGETDLSLADTSDEELRALAQASCAPVERAAGAAAPSPTNEPSEAEIAEALEEYRQERDRQRALRDAIAELEEKNRPYTKALP